MPATQIQRPFRIKTPLGEDALLIDSFEGHESVSGAFHFLIKVLSPDPNVDMKGLLTKPVVLSLPLTEDTERHLHGHVTRIRLLEYGEDGMAAYEMEVGSWLWFLNLYSDCRIFQNKTVPEIVQKVFKDRGFTDYKEQLTGSYPPREYCVQYRETDLNFISRLLEEEGIFYFLEHRDEKHTLVLADAKSAFTPSPHKPKARFLASTGSVQGEETVISLVHELNLHVGTASLTDYDFEKPNTSLYSTLPGEFKGEHYDYPGKYKTKDEGDRYARLRLEEHEVELVKVRGRSNCMGFECGYKFTLEEFYRDDANQEYTITGLEHRGRNASYRSGTPEPFEYSNQFEAIPSSVPYRPKRRAKKPMIYGTQTAVVVGKSGEDIWTDQYGRVKVQFFWDREGVKDENSSCWIRVAQGWAGKQWGSIYIPRIGQEVVVTFLEGDPDCPLITGSVYNGDQKTPYTLPDDQTKSTSKSLSSKGGGGYNEIRYEDKKGYEQVYMHGEKDLDIRIKNDRREWIGYDRHLIVKRDKLEQVERDEHIWVMRDQVEKIGRDHHVEIKGKCAVKITESNSLCVEGDVAEEFSGNQSTQVTRNLTIKALQVVIEANMGITLKVGGSFITIDPTGVAIYGPIVQINSAGAPLVGVPGVCVPPICPTYPYEADDGSYGGMTPPHGSYMGPKYMSKGDVSGYGKWTPRQPGGYNGPTHYPDSEENKKKKSWIEIQLCDQDKKPVPGEPYRVTLPDGTTLADGTTDEKGHARVDNIDPGTCKVTFPEQDKKSWDPI